MKSISFYPERDKQYQKFLTNIIEHGKATQYRTSIGVNQQLLKLYCILEKKSPN